MIRPDVPDSGTFYGEPKFSPDGTLLLVSELRPGVNGVHGVMTLDGGNYQMLETDYGARALWLSDSSIVSYGYTPQTAPAGEQLIVRFLPGVYDAAETVYSLPSDRRIETLIEGILGEIRLVVRTGENAPPEMIDVAYGSGDQATITALPPLVAPRLSYDGAYVAGYLSLTEINGIRQGPLTIFSAETGMQGLLGTPGSVWAFQWAR
jgi:hypothetical protein